MWIKCNNKLLNLNNISIIEIDESNNFIRIDFSGTPPDRLLHDKISNDRIIELIVEHIESGTKILNLDKIADE